MLAENCFDAAYKMKDKIIEFLKRDRLKPEALFDRAKFFPNTLEGKRKYRDSTTRAILSRHKMQKLAATGDAAFVLLRAFPEDQLLNLTDFPSLIKRRIHADQASFVKNLQAASNDFGFWFDGIGLWYDNTLLSIESDDDRRLVLRHHCLGWATNYIEKFVETYLFFDAYRARVTAIVSGNRKKDLLGREIKDRVIPELAKFVAQHRDDCSHRDPYVRSMAEILFRLADKEAAPSQQISSPRHLVGRDFENSCADELRKLDYVVELTKASGDFGGDIIARKEEYAICVQCKRTSAPVGVKAVQEVSSARKHYACDYAVVIGLAGFTLAAQELAATARVVLCTVDQLPSIETRLFNM